MRKLMICWQCVNEYKEQVKRDRELEESLNEIIRIALMQVRNYYGRSAMEKENERQVKRNRELKEALDELDGMGVK